jgi:hypothetical protein
VIDVVAKALCAAAGRPNNGDAPLCSHCDRYPDGRVVCIYCYLIDGRTGTLDECLHDGDAFVTWDDGTFGTVRWYHLAPSAKVKVTDNGWEAVRAQG